MKLKPEDTAYIAGHLGLLLIPVLCIVIPILTLLKDRPYTDPVGWIIGTLSALTAIGTFTASLWVLRIIPRRATQFSNWVLDELGENDFIQIKLTEPQQVNLSWLMAASNSTGTPTLEEMAEMNTIYHSHRANVLIFNTRYDNALAMADLRQTEAEARAQAKDYLPTLKAALAAALQSRTAYQAAFEPVRA